MSIEVAVLKMADETIQLGNGIALEKSHRESLTPFPGVAQDLWFPVPRQAAH